MRYDRQTIMEEIGGTGQEKLKNSHVVVIGTGGLGSPVLSYLTMAGIGKITIVDYDTVSESNLNRQFLHGTGDIGHKKLDSATNMLKNLNPLVELIPKDIVIERYNAKDILRGSHMIVDCVDNIETRMAVNEAALSLDIPLIEGGITGFYGFILGVTRRTACLECINLENTQIQKPIPAFGPTAGVIGSLQANLSIRCLLGIGNDDMGRLINYDGKSMAIDSLELGINPECLQHSKYGGVNERG